MRRNQGSSRAYFGNTSNETPDRHTGNATASGWSSSYDEDYADEVEESDDVSDNGDEYQNSAVKQKFKKEYEQASSNAQRAGEAPPAIFSTRSCRTRQAVDYRERGVEDIPLQGEPKVIKV